MERLTKRDYHDFAIPIRGTDAVSMLQTTDRLATIEDILGDEYDLDRLRVLVNQRTTMREEVAERFSITKDIPIDRLRELAQADREGKIPRYAIGDTVYDRYGEPWQVVSAEVHSMRTKNEWLYRCGHEGTDDYCALWHFEVFQSREAALRRERE